VLQPLTACYCGLKASANMQQGQHIRASTDDNFSCVQCLLLLATRHMQHASIKPVLHFLRIVCASAWQAQLVYTQ
jgi:Zn-finger protein